MLQPGHLLTFDRCPIRKTQLSTDRTWHLLNEPSQMHNAIEWRRYSAGFMVAAP
jgi:hypothetical protein